MNIKWQIDHIDAKSVVLINSYLGNQKRNFTWCYNFFLFTINVIVSNSDRSIIPTSTCDCTDAKIVMVAIFCVLIRSLI